MSLEAILASNGLLSAFVDVLHEPALREARAVDKLVRKGRRRAPAVPRRPHRHQGPEPRPGLVRALRLARVRAPLHAVRRREHDPPPRGRVRRRGKDGDQRARRPPGDRAGHPSTHAEPVGPRRDRGGLERRRGGGAGGGDDPHRARERRGGVHSHPGVLLPPGGVQTVARSRGERVRAGRRLDPLHVGPDGPLGGRRGGDARRPRRRLRREAALGAASDRVVPHAGAEGPAPAPHPLRHEESARANDAGGGCGRRADRAAAGRARARRRARERRSTAGRSRSSSPCTSTSSPRRRCTTGRRRRR